METADIIREVRSTLFERGWHRGGFNGADGSLCVYAAIDAVVPRKGEGDWTAAYDTIIEALPSPHKSIWVWNDAAATCFDDVVALLDRAEKIAERDG